MILENATKQKIDSVFEDQQYISFYFEKIEVQSSDKILDNDSIETTKPVIIAVHYQKPEALINGDLQITNSSYSTRIYEYYKWSNGYYKMGSKSGIFDSIANTLLTYSPIRSKTVSLILGEAISGFLSIVDKAMPVTAETYNKYYYKNRVGQVQSNNIWMSTAYVGSRRTFLKVWTTYYDSYGQPLSKNYENDGKPSANPTNYNDIEKKSYYDNDSWIKNRAIQALSSGSGIYMDVYAN